MPFAKLNRNWFSNGFRYRSDRGRIEISKGQIKDLPSDAEVYSDTGELLGKAGEIRDMKFPEKIVEPSPEKEAADKALADKLAADDKEAKEASDKAAADKEAFDKAAEKAAAKPVGLDLTKK